MNKKTIVAVAAVLVVLGAGYGLAAGTGDSFWNSMMGYGDGFWNGMMGYGSSHGIGNGVMGGHGSMMGGYGNGMMGYSNGYRTGQGMIGGYGGVVYGATGSPDCTGLPQ